jgi:DNA topoisomerase I
MENIRSSKKDLEKKERAVIKKAEDALTKISVDFKKQEAEIGKELVDANNALWEQQKEGNKLGIKCPNCNTGDLTIKFSPRFKNYFVACSAYPDCRQTYSLPSRSLIKKTDKICETCKWPMVISIRQGKRPWILCFNPKCTSRQQKPAENSNNEDSPTNEEGEGEE